MFTGMVEVQQFDRVGPAIGGHVPDPSRSVRDDENRLSPPQSPPLRLPLQAPAHLHAITLPTNHHFLREHPSPSFRLARLLLQVEHPHLQFVPFYTLFLSLFLSPPRPTKASLPAVQHKDCHLRASSPGLHFHRQGL